MTGRYADLENTLRTKVERGEITAADADAIREFSAFLAEAGPLPGRPGADRARRVRALARYDPESMAALALSVLTERDRLRAVLVDIADHGLRADLTPTMPSGPDLYRAFVNYLGECDTTLRDRARRALVGESEGSGGQGRETP